MKSKRIYASDCKDERGRHYRINLSDALKKLAVEDELPVPVKGNEELYAEAFDLAGERAMAERRFMLDLKHQAEWLVEFSKL